MITKIKCGKRVNKLCEGTFDQYTLRKNNKKVGICDSCKRELDRKRKR